MGVCLLWSNFHGLPSGVGPDGTSFEPGNGIELGKLEFRRRRGVFAIGAGDGPGIRAVDEPDPAGSASRQAGHHGQDEEENQDSRKGSSHDIALLSIILFN
jgi:hypothetical protein